MSYELADYQNTQSRHYPASLVEFARMIGVIHTSPSLKFSYPCIHQKKQFSQKVQPTSSRFSKFFNSDYAVSGSNLNVPVSTTGQPALGALNKCQEPSKSYTYSSSEKDMPPILQELFVKDAPPKMSLPTIKPETSVHAPNVWALPPQVCCPTVRLNNHCYYDKPQTSCCHSPSPVYTQVPVHRHFQFPQHHHICNRPNSENSVLPVLQELFANASGPPTHDRRSSQQGYYSMPPGFPHQICDAPVASQSVCECRIMCPDCGSSRFSRPYPSLQSAILADDQHQLNLAVSRGDMPAAHAIRSRMTLRAMKGPPNNTFTPT